MNNFNTKECETTQDFTFPLSQEDIDKINQQVHDVEDEIALADFHGVIRHDLEVERNNLLQLFQDDKEWYDTHPIHW